METWLSNGLGGAATGQASEADSTPTPPEGLSHPLRTVTDMETGVSNGLSGAATAAGEAMEADSTPTPPEALSHPLRTVTDMETGVPNGLSGAATAAGEAPEADSTPTPPEALSHPLRTVTDMESLRLGAPGGNAAADSPVAVVPGGVGGPAVPGIGELVPGIVFVGAPDALGRVTGLVDALLAELSALSLAGAGRDVLRSLVASLGRVRAGADAAEARAVTALERLGDGGVDAVEVLRRSAGSSQREAQRRKRRAEALAKMPNVAGALAAGDISAEHAEALARAAAATSHEAVDRDADLLAQVAGVPADRAGRQVQAWTQRNQDPLDLHEQHLRQRRRRRLNFGDGEDGMLMAHAAFDRVLGAQFRSLINGIADRIWRAEGGRDNPDSRSAEQRRLDALAIAVGLEPEPAANAPAGPAKGSATGGANAAPGQDESQPEPAAAAAADPANAPAAPARGSATGGANAAPGQDESRPRAQQPSRAGRAAAGSGDASDERTAGGGRAERFGRAVSGATERRDRQTRNGGMARTGQAMPDGSGTKHGSNEPPANPATFDSGPERDQRAASGRAARSCPAGAAGRGSSHVSGDVAIDDPARRARAGDGGPGYDDSRPCTEEQNGLPAPARTAADSGRSELADVPMAAGQFGDSGGQAAPGQSQPVPPRHQPVPPRHQIVIVASADVVSGKDPQGRCEIPGVGPIPQSELERLACDAELFGVLFSGEGEPLWHGRGERTATDAQRRALLARDGVCVLCAEEPSRCESHHIVPWAKPGEGPTDIDNLALLCGTCHRRLHNHKRILTRGPDGAWGTAPDPRHAGRRQHADSTSDTAPDPRHTHQANRSRPDATTDRDPPGQ